MSKEEKIACGKIKKQETEGRQMNEPLTQGHTGVGVHMGVLSVSGLNSYIFACVCVLTFL